MYFIEKLVKKFKKQKLQDDNFNPLNEENTEPEVCEHIFMPIDSTGEILTCKNCGFTVKKSELKDINFFRQH